VLFEWDKRKSETVKAKHGISFEEVEEAIARHGIIAELGNPAYPEQRVLVFRFKGVIHTAAVERRGEKTRLITAHQDRKIRRKYGP